MATGGSVLERKRSVLVVDDEPAIGTLLSRYLAAKGFDVVAVYDGNRVLAAIAQRRPDVILLDLMMPGMGGMEVLQALRAGGIDVPVIIMTAMTDTAHLTAAIEAGAIDSVTKPFSLPKLLDRIQQVLVVPVASLTDQAIVDADVVDGDEEFVILAPMARPPALIDDEASIPNAAMMSIHSVDYVDSIDVVDSGIPSPATGSASISLPADARAMALPSTGTSTSIFARLRGLTRRVVPVQQPTLQAGVILADRYRLHRPLGTGSFGTVWQARHIELDLDVAVKVLHRDAQPVRPNESALQSFRKEAVLLARVQSAFCVRATDFGVTDEGHAWLVMELLRGETLRQHLTRAGPLPLSFACGVTADVCEALASAHRHGVIHRDVKAANVFVADTTDDPPRRAIKLIDFGAANAVDDENVGIVLVGTPSHMAPERFTAARGTPQTDVYAAGVMLLHLLTGSVPYHAEDLADLADLHRDAPIPRPSSLRPELTAVDAVVARLLAKDPAQRPAAAAAAAALRAIAER
jgi:CheY-like chemotaxis protein